MSNDSSDPNPSFEKYKYKVELFKWLVGSVALVVMTAIIDWGFKDRAAGMQEIQQYDKYATELIVLNNDPVKKRMLAQFFSKVTPSEKLRKGWQEYYKEVDAEYISFLRKDSIAQAKLKALMDKDTEKLTESQKKEKEQLENQVQETKRMINQPLVLPNSSVIPVVYVQIGSEEQRNFAKQITEQIIAVGYKAPGIELVESARKMASNEIRYFRESDENYAKVLQNMLKNQNIEVIVKPTLGYSNKTKEGTIELWLK
jgi:hypothetical protein